MTKANRAKSRQKVFTRSRSGGAVGRGGHRGHAAVAGAGARSRAVAQVVPARMKLKQLAQALLNHHDVYKKFPATSNQGICVAEWPASGGRCPARPAAMAKRRRPVTPPTRERPKPPPGYSWIVRLLPFMDEAPLYNVDSARRRKNSQPTPSLPTTSQERNDAGRPAFFDDGHLPRECTIQKHFATIELDEVICPSYQGHVRP